MTETNLKGFIDAVNSDVDQKIEEILSEANEKRKEMLESAEDEALNEAFVKIKNSVSDVVAKNKMIMSKAEQEARIAVLTHRESLVKKIFADVEERITEFTATSDYLKYLAKLLKNEKTDRETVVYLKPDDMKYTEALSSALGIDCSFSEDMSIKYGGLSVYDKNSSVLINKTIDNMLDEQKKNFGSEYKLS